MVAAAEAPALTVKAGGTAVVEAPAVLAMAAAAEAPALTVKAAAAEAPALTVKAAGAAVPVKGGRRRWRCR
ncbi:uncharacterized protein SOCE836_047070 [Sorangium cellulosum]|uniref:Uncharacterized protein n=1 Tax=Sorangium cellulosum TaxID=56 RepID=A0A4P2QQT3_SORCE|nr:uncharacterized protein SOCE836_047070 [Sorangium cellulosum]